MSRLARRRAHVDCSVQLGPLVLPNPVIAASGTYGHGDEVARLGDPSLIGAVTVKSLSAGPWPGNPAPRLCDVPGGMLNSVGLQNPGVAHWCEHELPALVGRGARVIASVWGRTVDEFSAATAGLAPARADLVAVEVNVSCPNLEDRSRMFAHSAEATAAVASAAVAAADGLPVFVKLSPNTEHLVDVARAAMGAGATALTLVNTVMGMSIDVEHRTSRLGTPGGGVSGPAIRPTALRAVYEVSQALPGVPIVGTGGVTRATHAVEMLLAGATAVGVGTATFRDPRAAQKVARDLSRWCARRGVARVADLSGGLIGGASAPR